MALVGLASQARADVEVIAEYRLGASTPQITYTGGPETMPDAAGKNHELKREGNPRFVASAPSVPSAKGAGALEFDGNKDAYVRSRRPVRAHRPVWHGGLGQRRRGVGQGPQGRRGQRQRRPGLCARAERQPLGGLRRLRRRVRPRTGHARPVDPPGAGQRRQGTGRLSERRKDSSGLAYPGSRALSSASARRACPKNTSRG